MATPPESTVGSPDERSEDGPSRPVGASGRAVIVALSGTIADHALIETAARLAGAGERLIGVHVMAAGAAKPAAMVQSRTLLGGRGGEYREVLGDDIAATLVALAAAEGGRDLVVGVSRRSRWDALLHGSLVRRIIAAGQDLDVTIVALPSQPRTRRRPPRLAALPARRQVFGLAVGAIALGLLTAIVSAFDSVLTLPSILLLFLVVVVGVSAIGGLWPAIGAAVASFLIVNWFFTPPIHTFVIRNGEHWIALAVFVGVGVFVSALVEVAVRRAAEAARARDEAQKLARLAGMAPVTSLLDGFMREFSLTGAAIITRTDGGGWEGAESSGAPVSAATTTATLTIDHEHKLLIAGPAFPPGTTRLVAAFVQEISTALTIESLRRVDEQARELQRATELLTSLLAAVSHDVRTPLASIRAAVTSLLATDVRWSDSQVAEFLETIDDEASHLDTMLGNLLDISRLRAGDLVMIRQRITWDEVVSAVVAGFGDRAAAIRVDVDESLPAVIADPGLLERSLANVIANALVAAPTGTSVGLTGRCDGDHVLVAVSDRGSGIDAGDRERAMAPFQRLGDQHSSSVNVGLGLAVARGFIEAMGGTIELGDTPGGGLTVTLALPVARAID